MSTLSSSKLNQIEYIIQNNKKITLNAQCIGINPSTLPFISLKDDFHRSNLFFKCIKDNKSIPLDIKALPVEEEKKFIESIREYLKGKKNINKEFLNFLGRPNISFNDLDIEYRNYSYGSLPDSSGNRVQSALKAFECEKKATTYSGLLDRYITNILKYTYEKQLYSLDLELYHTNNVSSAENNFTPYILDEVGIYITNNLIEDIGVHKGLGLPDIVDVKDSIYILTDNKIDYIIEKIPGEIEKYRINAKNLYNSQLFRDLIKGDHILDIHPRLVYLLYNDPKTRSLLGNEMIEYNPRNPSINASINAEVQQTLGHVRPIFNGKLVKSWMKPERVELAVFYWALCWSVFNNTHIPDFYITPYNEQVAFINKFIREAEPSRLEEEVTSIMATVDWAADRKESVSPNQRFRAFMDELIRMAPSQIAQTGNTRRNYTVKRGKAHYAAQRRAVSLVKDQCKGVNPAKLAATGEEDDYHRSLVFFKALKDREPISLASKGVEDEQEFVGQWIDSLIGIHNQVAWSIYFFLGLPYTTSVREVEEAYIEFINSSALAAFGCKRRSSGSIRNITDFLNILLHDARRTHNTHYPPPVKATSPGKNAGPPASKNNSKFRWGGAMPDFYKYYLPEITAAPTTCKLPASAKALEKIPALSLEQMFKRALLFWKRVQDGLPVPINERALPPAEEEAFIAAWKGAIAGAADRASASADRSAQPALPAADEEAVSLEFLRATDATRAQYESEFNNVTLPLSAFDCKRRPDGSLSFNRLVGYIQKTAAERQYAFEANVLGAEFGTLAAGAVSLATVAFVSDRETPVQRMVGKTAVAVPAAETLFIQVGSAYQARPGKPYILPGDALLKAALPRVAFTQRAVVDLHPKVAYFLWKDPKLRNELLLPCFGEAFMPSFRAVHKSLQGYENEFAAVYYQLCYDAAHWVPSGKLAGSNAAYYGGNNSRVPSAGLFPLTPPQSPRGSIVEDSNTSPTRRSINGSPQSVITSVPAPIASSAPSNRHTKTPADFYRLPNSDKYAKIIQFLQANPDYTLPSLQWTTPKRGFFSRLFTRKRKPIMNVLRNLKKQPANKTNSIVLEMLFTEGQTGPMVLQNGGRRRNITRRIRR